MRGHGQAGVVRCHAHQGADRQFCKGQWAIAAHFAMFLMGALVRVAPNHTCLTVAAHDRYYVLDGGDQVIAVWDRVNGW